ncbi:glycosyltransferase family A protein [Micrococcus luteus]|uniref:glycosyltransferase family 2 protein n=1 Tax=Micrococcus luteus TaxID=1270 RepID=UPI00341D4922
MKPTVSVIIPCYNAEAWVSKQVAAVLAQLDPPDELVLVDNRSTDGTPALLAEASAADPRVRVVEATERQGVNHARNTGLAAARGDILLICDADDALHPGWVDAFREALADGGLAGGIATPVDDDGRRLGPDIGLGEIFGGPPYPLGGNMGMSREVFRTVGGFDESFVGGHDEADFAWRAAAAGWTTKLAMGAHIDYLQRPTVQGALRQRRSYARTSIQLWARHPDVADRHGVSFSGAVKGLVKVLPRGLRTLRGHGSLTDAASWGWTVGLVEGHLRYRILGSPPARVLAAVPSDGGYGQPSAAR